VSNAVAASPSATNILEWLSISLTHGLGPTKARNLVEHFGGVEAVFHASLTELESTGIQAVSAQSIALESRRNWHGKKLRGPPPPE
jgi:predicted Rossmann fold nucleotide-binding protein DprA/Smf involved in DNA uptake